MERSEKEDAKGNGIPDALRMRSRNVPWIDAWKGWLILLVVVGHVAGAFATWLKVWIGRFAGESTF